LNFTIKTINLNINQNKENNFLSFTRRVPTLETNDFSLSESSAISEYLDERYPDNNIYPKSLNERARAREIQAWLRSDLLALRNERSTETIFIKPTNKPLSEEAKESASKLVQATNSLLFENKMNLFSEWCIADVDLSLMLNRLILNGYEVSDTLRRYVEHQWKNEFIQDWIKLRK
jgi:glutathione S-transferase